MKLTTRTLAVVILVASAGASVLTADSSDDVADIEVIGSRLRRDRAKIPASVTVVTQEQVRTSGAANVDDLLRSVSGINVMRGVGIGNGMPIQIQVRGVTGDHRVLLLVDGLPLNEAATGYLSLNEVPVHAVQRVEVIRGPFSSLFGTDAFGGVINIITKQAGEEPEVDIITRAGNGGLRQAALTHRGRTDSVSYSVLVDHRSINNYLARPYSIERRYDRATQQYIDTAKTTVNYDYTDMRILGSASIDLSDNAQLTLQARYYEDELGYGQKDLVPLHPAPEDNINKSKTAMLGGHLTAVVSPKLDLRFGGYYRNQTRELWGLDFSHFAASSAPVYARSLLENDVGEWQIETSADADILPSHTFSFGADFRRSDADFSPVMDDATRVALPWASGAQEHAWNAGLYVQDEISVGKKLTVVAGARFDYHSEFSDTISPRAGAIYNLSKDTTIRASVGRAFRAPTLVELFQPTLSFGYVTYQSNPNLKPEFTTSGDVEIEHRFTDKLAATVAVFYNAMDDLIENQLSGNVLSNINISEAKSVGVEASVAWAIADCADASFSYTYQEAEDTQTGANLDYVPEGNGSLGLRLHQTRGKWELEASLTELYVGTRDFLDWDSGQRYELENYLRTDLALRGTYDDRIWIAVSMQNATDEKYQESRLIPLAPGRLVSVELGARF